MVPNLHFRDRACKSPLPRITDITRNSWRAEDIGFQRTELSSPLTVNGRAGPIIRPGDIPVRAQGNHGLDGEGHPGLRLAGRLVLSIVGHVGRAVEQRVNPVPAIRPDSAAVPGLGVFLDDVAKLPDRGTRLHGLDREVEALPRRLNHPNRIGVCLRLIADVVGLVQVAVVTFVVKGDVEVEDIAVQEYPLIRDTVADDLVRRGADRLGKVVVVEGRGV